ncbi:MAG: TRAP transporter permease [Burkholderiaceae bacterium]|nr:TRAP transporter permease [Burkholderiaceae bacterium]
MSKADTRVAQAAAGAAATGAAATGPVPALDGVDGEHAFPAGVAGRWLFWLAFAFSAFQLAVAAHVIDLPSQIVRAVHLGFLLSLGLPLVALKPGRSRALRAGAIVVTLLAAGVALYQAVEHDALLLRAGDPSDLDLLVGSASLVALFVGAGFVMGAPLPVLCGVFLLYCLFGQYLPAPLNHRGYDFSQVVDHMAFGTEGIYGIPLYVSSTYIFLFILFGAFLEKAGMIKLFTDVSLGLVGHARGGPAKVAVLSSGMMGTISGSGVANVVTTGQFTIPLMKRFGYRPAFAGGVEATASMGGQIMPPVMGAVAFIMAETLDVPYAQIVKAAVIPAILYFASAFWMVHLEAGRRGLLGMARAELPSPIRALREGWHLILPLAALVWLLFGGYTPLFAGTLGLALTAVLILGSAVALGLPVGAIRVAFWVALGLGCAAFARFGMAAVGVVIALLVAANALRAGGRQTLAICRDALADGARTAVPVGIACGIVGIIIGTMTLTGAANTFGQAIVAIGRDSLFVSLLLTMVTCLILGMGIPTIPNYIITSSIAGPALLGLGVPLIVSHMFVFYFGILADLTPPVALACFAAAPIARESGLRISIDAVRIAAAGFVIPFMAVYTPALMLQPGGPLAASIGFIPAVAYVLFKCALAIMLWGAAVIGFLQRPLGAIARAVAVLGAGLLVAALPWTDELGLAIGLGFVAWQFLGGRRATETA